MSEKKQLIVGGQLQSRTGLETTADAGHCIVTGEPLYRCCLTPEVARIDREPGSNEDGTWNFQFTRTTGRDGGEVRARNRREALLVWYSEEVQGLETDLAVSKECYSEAIDITAIEIIEAALKSDPKVSRRGIPHYEFLFEAGKARTNDLHRYAAIRGYALQGTSCHLSPCTAHLWPMAAEKPEDIPEEI